MSDDPKQLPAMMARVGGTFFGDNLLSVAHNGADSKGRSASKIMADMLADPQSSMDGADILNLDTKAGSWGKLSKIVGVPVAAAATPLILMGLGPVGLAFGAAAVFWPALSDNRIVRLFVMNGFSEPIVASAAFMHNGQETAECARGFVGSDGKTFVAANHRQIPPMHIEAPPKQAGKIYMGVGMFQYEKNTVLGFSVTGTAGALSFTCADPAFGKPIGLAFVNGFGTDLRLKLTDQLDVYGDIQKFYDAAIETAETRTTRAIDSILPTGVAARVHACFAVNPPDDLNVRSMTERADIVISFQPS